MLREDVFRELRQLDDIIQNSTVTYDGETFTYRDACARWENECFVNDILNLDHIIKDVSQPAIYLCTCVTVMYVTQSFPPTLCVRTSIIQVETGQLNLTFPVMFNPVTWDAHAFPVYFGGTQVSDDNFITLVPALQLIYFATADTKRQDARGAAWEESFLENVGKAEDTGFFKHIAVARFASKTLDHELERNTRTVVPYFGSTFLFMALFSIITCMMGDQVRSKPLLGLMGNISAAMATLAAFGLAMYLGIEFIGINLAAPFLMIGK